MAGGKYDPKFIFIFQKWFLMAEVLYAWIDYIAWNLLTEAPHQVSCCEDRNQAFLHLVPLLIGNIWLVFIRSDHEEMSEEVAKYKFQPWGVWILQKRISLRSLQLMHPMETLMSQVLVMQVFYLMPLEAHEQEIERNYRSFLWSLVFAIPVFFTSMVFMYVPGLKHG